jgi:hypothetical protein
MKSRPSAPDSAMYEEMSRLLPVPLESDLPSSRHDVLKDHLMSEAARPNAVTGHPSYAKIRWIVSNALSSAFRPSAQHSVRSRKRRTVMVAASTAAIAVGAMLTLPGTSSTDGANTAPRSVHAGTVAEVLDAAATYAGKGPAKEPGLHQWVYTDRVDCMPTCHRSPSWIRYDGTKRAMLGRTPSTGSRTVVVVEAGWHFNPGQLGEQPKETREVLSRLSSDPRKLLQQVSTDPFFTGFPGVEKPATTPGAQFTRILNILQAAPSIPPRVNAALYPALELIPGTRLVGTPMKDALGRPGLAIAFDFHDGKLNTHEYLILDPKTYAYRGWRRDWHGARAFSDTFARGATGVVDHPGQVPGGPAPDPSNVVERPFVPIPGSR